MSHHAFSRILNSTSVTGSCQGSFIHEGASNLVVLKHDFLEVYTVREGAEDANTLILEASYTLLASADQMEKVRFPGQSVDSVLLAFTDAKITLLQWDASEHRLATKSLHLLEDPKILLERTLADDVASALMLRVDPGALNRPPQCVTLLVYNRFLFVIPFKADGDTRFPLGRATTIDFHEKKYNLHGVRDIQFTRGSYTPVLMVLHEHDPTWSGRLTLAIGEKQHYIEHKRLTNTVSSCSLLFNRESVEVNTSPLCTRIPYNAFGLFPLKADPYGCLVLCVNVVMHLVKDERTGFAAHLNEYGRVELDTSESLQMPFGTANVKDQDGRVVPPMHNRHVTTLENAVVADLPGHDVHVIVAFGSGDIALLNVGRNKQNGTISSICYNVCEGVRGLSEAGGVSCPIPSTITAFGEFVFIGSRTGDPVLLRKEALPSFRFHKVCSLLNTGPVVDVAVGDSSVQVEGEEEEFKEYPAPSLGMATVVPVNLKPVSERSFADRHEVMELVALTGHARDGAVCILSKKVKPLTLASHPMNANSCFALRLPGTNKRKLDDEDAEFTSAHHHDCLLLATAAESMVMRVGKKLVERKKDTPLSRLATVFAANMLDGAIAVQVTPLSVIVLEREGHKEHEIKTEDRAPGAQPRAHQALSTETHCIILMTDGTLRIIAVALSESGELSFSISTAPEQFLQTERGFISAISLQENTVCEESFRSNVGAPTKPLLTVAWTSGCVQIVDLQSFEVLQTLHNVMELSEYLYEGSSVFSPEWEKEGDNEKPLLGVPAGEHIVAVFCGRVEATDNLPHLIVISSDDTLCAYRAFHYEGAVRWIKVVQEVHRNAEALNHLTAPPRLSPIDDFVSKIVVKRDDAGNTVNVFPKTPRPSRITSFANIFGNEGIFIRHMRTSSFAFSEKGTLRVHGMAREEEVRCMTPLNSPTCTEGFSLLTESGLKIMLLTWHKRMNFKSPCPTRKIFLRRTPHKLVFDGNLRTYTIVVSDEKPFKPVKTTFDSESDVFLQEGDQKVVPPEEGIPVPMNGSYELLLYSAFSWRPFTGIAMKENEKILCCEGIYLKRYDIQRRYTETTYLQACGSGFPISEDVPCRGRLILFRVRAGRSKEDRVLDIDYEMPTQGPVTAVTCNEDGLIFAAIAARIHVFSYDWHRKDMSVVAWCDARFYSSSIRIFKGFLVAADIFHSVALFKWTEMGSQLSLVARDINKLPANATDFSVDHGNISSVVADNNGNISILQYDSALSTRALQTISDINISSSTFRFIKLRTIKVPLQGSEWTPPVAGPRTALLFGTKHGGLCIVQPISEHIHRDLHWLHTKMVTDVEHFAGLHPRGSRKFKGLRQKRPDPKNRRSVITDLQVLFRYLELPKKQQKELATAANLGSVEQISSMLKYLKQEVRYL